MSVITLTIRNVLPEIVRITTAIEQLAVAQGLDAHDVWPLCVAIDEVLSNVIRYAYTDGAEHDIEVRISIDACAISAQIEDDGKPFDPLSAPPLDVEQHVCNGNVGGLGINIVCTLMNEVAYARIGDRNRFTMRRLLAPVREPARIELRESIEEGIRILNVEGRLDSVTSSDFEARLEAMLHDAHARLLIDLERLQYISSAGFRVLYRVLMQTEAREGRVVLCGLSAEVRELFAMTGFDKLLRIAATRAEAIAALR